MPCVGACVGSFWVLAFIIRLRTFLTSVIMETPHPPSSLTLYKVGLIGLTFTSLLSYASCPLKGRGMDRCWWTGVSLGWYYYQVPDLQRLRFSVVKSKCGADTHFSRIEKQQFLCDRHCFGCSMPAKLQAPGGLGNDAGGLLTDAQEKATGPQPTHQWQECGFCLALKGLAALHPM